MKGYMKIFEDIMVAVAFAEAGATDLLQRCRKTIYMEAGDQIWDLS